MPRPTRLITAEVLDISAPPKGFPSHVTLLSQRWQIHYCTNLMATQGHYGRTQLHARCIFIDISGALDSIRDTLIHEILHAIIDLSSVTTDLGEDLEERVVRSLAPKLLDFLRSNKRFW